MNIVESTRQELGLTYKELGEAIGYDEDSLKNIASKKEVSKQTTKVIELYIETIKLKKQLKDSDILPIQV
ncbi:MAG: transcriptional regulator [Sulfurimonas sp.]|nr:transcriptional regulator [Sulfurimonas sp.]